MLQHDDHCIMNFNWEPARITWLAGQRLGIVCQGQSLVVDLSRLDWQAYDETFQDWLARYRRRDLEDALEAQRAAEREAEEITHWQAHEAQRLRDRDERARRWEAEQQEKKRNWKPWHGDVPWGAEPEAHFHHHIDTGDSRCFATADELEHEVVLADLEYVDAELIAAVDCERSILRRNHHEHLPA
jgi:hypothetical protein